MSSSGKKKTTMAKLNRERKLRERRLDKQARKEARKQNAADQSQSPDELVAGYDGEHSELAGEHSELTISQPGLAPVADGPSES